MKNYKSNLVWIDLEMTGLDLSKDVILEISTVITNNSLDIVAHGPTLVINQPDSILATMDDWCVKTHTASGLVEAVKNSKISLEQAERETLNFLKLHTKNDESPICGNSVWQDRNFLRKYMPQIDNYLNYRIIDVSSIKECVNRWYPDSVKADYKKPENHRAQEDIIYSIDELRHYRKYFFFPE